MEERRSLVEQIADLDDQFQQGAIDQEDFRWRRQQLKDHVRDIDLSSQRE